MDGSPSPGYFAVSDMFAAREWLPAGNVDNQVSTAFAVLLFLVWSATCFARRRNSAFLKVRHPGAGQVACAAAAAVPVRTPLSGRAVHA